MATHLEEEARGAARDHPRGGINLSESKLDFRLNCHFVCLTRLTLSGRGSVFVFRITHCVRRPVCVCVCVQLVICALTTAGAITVRERFKMAVT